MTSVPSISSASYSTLRRSRSSPFITYIPIFLSYVGPPSSPPTAALALKLLKLSTGSEALDKAHARNVGRHLRALAAAGYTDVVNSISLKTTRDALKQAR